ncbi:MAG: polyphosphate polymerase domain-containing protein [Clostridia bacterium]|nr:polyphosphate polymerase domain-containing protein [Clostridia bacterium]
MAYQAVFKRYEMKYLLSAQQKERIMEAMAPHMAPDPHGRSTVRNIYFDTDSYRIIRRSIEKPAYKEKLRVRSYCRPEPESPVFVELKRKYESVVYKRRLSLPDRRAMEWVCGLRSVALQSQIAREIDYFLRYYQTLRPTVFLSYEREAYHALDGDLRVTFDDRLLCRQEALSLESEAWGTPLLEGDQVLMELKTCGGLPLWMTAALRQAQAFKTSFSKYGAAYRTMIFPNLQGGLLHA